MAFRSLAILIAACALPVQAAQAETLRVSGLYPAGSDEAATAEAIVVEPFSGREGAALSFRLEDRLREVTIGGEPWFAILLPQLAGEADAVLQGHAEPRFSESHYQGTRNICWRKDEEGNCVERRNVETRCVSLSVTLQPDMRLIANDGSLLWSSSPSRSNQFDFCPEFDAEPNIDATIDGWIADIAGQVRFDLAPRHRTRNVRIMESRRGLDRETRRAFRAAIAMTDTDEAAACDMFESLHAANPDHDSLMFNAGLCAEQGGAFALAEDRYRVALASRQSDDEATSGLRRIQQRRRAEHQIVLRQEAVAMRGEVHTIDLPGTEPIS